MHSVSTTHSGNCTTFRISGDLRGGSVLELERSWRKESRLCPKSMCIDLRSVREIDDSGKRLLCEMFGTGMEILIPVRNREKKT